MDKNTNPFLNPEWLGLQQQYIDALAALNSPRDNNRQSHNNQRPWNEALEHWRKSVESFLPGDGRVLFDNVLDQTRAFYSIADDFAALLQQISANPDSEDWQNIMAQHFGRMKTQFDALTADKQLDNDFPFFQSPLFDGWKKAVGTMSVLPEQMIGGFHDDAGKFFKRFLAMPGLGPAREFREKLADATLLWNEYETKLHEYQSVLAQIGKLALDRLEQKIIELAENEARISSLKQLYSLWVDANEEVFADFAFTGDHSRYYSGLVNALMQYRQKFNQILDEVLGLVNMPNNAAMQTVYKREQQMRHSLRDFADMQHRMQEQLQQLRAELDRLRGTANQPAARRRTAGPKKPSRKSS